MSGMAAGDMAGGSGSAMVQIPRYILEDSPLLGKKLKEFQEAETRARDAIALVGKAEEIGQLRSQAKVERDAADAASAETKEECAKLISDAIAQAEDLVDEARSHADEIISGAETKLEVAQRTAESAQLKMREAQQTEQDATETKKRLEAAADQLARKSLELADLQTQLLQEKSTLATVREQINLILE